MSVEEIREAAKIPEIVKQMEERVKNWCKRLAEVLKESEQIRRENDSSGNVLQLWLSVDDNLFHRASRWVGILEETGCSVFANSRTGTISRSTVDNTVPSICAIKNLKGVERYGPQNHILL